MILAVSGSGRVDGRTSCVVWGKGEVIGGELWVGREVCFPWARKSRTGLLSLTGSGKLNLNRTHGKPGLSAPPLSLKEKSGTRISLGVALMRCEGAKVYVPRLGFAFPVIGKSLISTSWDIFLL